MSNIKSQIYKFQTNKLLKSPVLRKWSLNNLRYTMEIEYLKCIFGHNLQIRPDLGKARIKIKRRLCLENKFSIAGC